MVVNHLYYNDAQPAGTPSQSFSFSPKLLQQALQNIYGPSFDPEKDIEPTFWQTFTKAFNQAADQGFSQSSYNPSQAFTSALRHSNAVFAAFKTHRLQNDLAQLLTDSNGNLKPFQQWKKDILPIASHQCRHWLQTEYDTAVLRAHQAADWQQFQAEKDVLPNLRWMPSTSPNPGADHLPFWNTVLPVDHPFWDQHRPGDRWNCKCSLSATDDPATSVPTAPASSAGGNRPHPGLDTNPGKTAQLFSDTHPYIKNAYPGAKEAVQRAIEGVMLDEIPTEKGRVRVHPKHGKKEKRENIAIATFLANKHGFDIELMPKEDGIKTADSFNHTLHKKQEYKISSTPTKSSIDNLIRGAKKQADSVVLQIESGISLGDLRDAITDRLVRAENITDITIILDGKDVTYRREQMLKPTFKIQREDFN